MIISFSTRIAVTLPAFPMLTILLYGILCVLMVLFIILVINLLTFPRLQPPVEAGVADKATIEGGKVRSRGGSGEDEGRGPLGRPWGGANAHKPLLSILVPARNEEQAIETCVRSLVAQAYEPLEVLVLNDNSTDATATLVQNIIATLPPEQKGRLRLVQGEDLPAGWIGKNFACQQLAQQAQGDYLLFTDADTQHAPGMATAVIACMQDYNVSLLTAQPEHVLGGLGECLIVPLLNFTIFTLLPVALIPRRPEPSLATGNGQLLCFQRATYTAIGGHERVKGSILEDVLLARATKAAGYRMIFVDALQLVRCRMYHTFADVWSGFSKNLFAFYNYALPFALIALVLNLLLFVFPPLLLLLALFPFIHLSNATLLAATSAYLLVVLMRLLLTARFVRTQRMLMFVLSFLHPLAILLECLILLNSIRWSYSRKGIMWKGRSYT